MANYYLKGIRQVKKETYTSAVENNTADGYIWFVRDTNEDGSVITNSGHIYLGERQYGELGQTITVSGNDMIDEETPEPIPPTPPTPSEEKTKEELEEVVENGGEITLDTDVNNNESTIIG